MPYYGNSLSEINTSLAITGLQVVPALDGSKITITWVNPVSGGWNATRILKRTTGFATQWDDPRAKVVYQGTGTEFIDTDIKLLTTYYYTVFGLNIITPVNDPAKWLYTNKAPTPLDDATTDFGAPLFGPPLFGAEGLLGSFVTPLEDITNSNLWLTPGLPASSGATQGYTKDSIKMVRVPSGDDFVSIMYGDKDVARVR